MEKYRVTATKFIGRSSDSERYTYEITFNQSLGHTGRFTGIEEGLNAYCKRELKSDTISAFKVLKNSVTRWIKG